MVCSVCQSEWFYEVTLQQYANMYSSNPGGDLHPIGQTNHQIRVCPCGQPFLPNIGGVRAGPVGNESTTAVMAAIKNAIQLRAQVPELIQNLSQDMVSKEELMTVINSLAERIDALERPVSSMPNMHGMLSTDAVSQPDTAPAPASKVGTAVGAPKKAASKNKVAEPAATENQ